MDVLECPAILTNRRRKGFEAYRSSVVNIDDCSEQLPIEVVETECVDLHLLEPPLCGIESHRIAAEVMGEVTNPAQETVCDPRCAARTPRDFSTRLIWHLDIQDVGRAGYDHCQVLTGIELEAVDNAEAVTQRSGQEPGASCGADQRESRQGETYAARRRALPNHQIELVIR